MIKRLLHALAMSVVVLTLSGCATINMGEYLDDKTVKIERIDSKHAKIGFVNIKRSDQETWIRGDIKPCIQTRGPIFGHLHVNVKSPDGKSIFNDTVDYKRRSVKARTAQFSVTLNLPIEDKSTITIKHHYFSSSD